MEKPQDKVIKKTSRPDAKIISKPTPEITPKDKNDYFEIKLPKFTKLSKLNTPLSPLWVIILIIFSYLLGMQTAKLTYIQDQMEENKLTTAQPAQNPNNPQQPALGKKVNIGIGSLPALGNNNAKVTMVEFSDFQCPFCEKFYKDTFPQIKKEYIDTGKIKFTFRHLPLEIHPLAPKAAEASECANDQGKFWEYHDELFNRYSDWSSLTLESLPSQLESFAESMGLNTQEFSTCLTSNKYTDKINNDKKEGQAAGATGTPSFFINGKILVGAMPFTTFKTLLDEELKK